jgi:hypothetical protein
MSKYHLEEPLFRSSCDTISWILQSINEGAEVTLKAAFAAAIFQRLPRRVYVEQEKEPLQILLNTTVDLDKKLVWIAEMKTEVVNEGQLVSERLRTLREWICVYPYRTLFESNAAARTAPYMHSHIAAPDGPYDLRRFHMVGLGTMGFALLNMYNELGMGTTYYSPHVFAMCYLVVGLKHSKRTTGTWATIEAVSDRHRKDIFISEDLPSKISDMVTRMRLASGASPAHIASMMRAQFTGRKVPSINSASTVRTWDITCSPIVSILRRYLSDEESLLRTVYALDSEIQKETGTRSSFIQLGTVRPCGTPDISRICLDGAEDGLHDPRLRLPCPLSEDGSDVGRIATRANGSQRRVDHSYHPFLHNGVRCIGRARECGGHSRAHWQSFTEGAYTTSGHCARDSECIR